MESAGKGKESTDKRTTGSVDDIQDGVPCLVSSPGRNSSKHVHLPFMTLRQLVLAMAAETEKSTKNINFQTTQLYRCSDRH